MNLLMFPGQGSQYSGMGKDWYDNFKESRQAFEEASDFSGLNLKKLCFDGSDSDLKATEITQPAILTTTVAIFRAIQSLQPISIKSHIFAGHSLGEYSALVCMGALTLGEAARLVNHRGRYMQEALPIGLGGMAALMFKPKSDGAEFAKKLCAYVQAQTKLSLSVANYNSPEQIVVAGHKQAIQYAIDTVAHNESYQIRKVVELQVSAPFHCALMQPAADLLNPELSEAKWQQVPDARYIANVDACSHSLAESALIVQRLTEQITGSVRWIESIQQAIRLGATKAFEIGPSKVLSGLVKRISLNEVVLEGQSIDRFEEYKSNDYRLS